MLLQEYATTVKSADVGLAWEVHFRAKRQFELTDLKVIFQFCLQVQSTSDIVTFLLHVPVTVVYFNDEPFRHRNGLSVACLLIV